MSKPFIPAEISYPTVWFLDAAFPMIAKTALNLEGVEITDTDRKMLRGLQKKRILYMSNHPSTIEPPVAYYVANAMGSRFHYMASRIVFDWGFGFVGELIKRIGAFSVLSGGADREALKTARSVLSSDSGKLVIYPEGMNGMENDNMLPFQPGAVQIGFWAYEDLKKKNSNEDIQILPAFVKYVLTSGREKLLKEITKSIGRIEDKLGIKAGERNLLRRFLFAGRVVLETAEKEYGIVPSADQDMKYRIGHVRHAALNKAAQDMGLSFDENADAIAKIREVFTALESFETGFHDAKRKEIDKEKIPEIKKHLERAYTFIVIKPDYLISRPTAERFMEWIYRFESLLFGKTELRPRKAILSFAPLISFADYYADYKQDKKKTVEKVTQFLRSQIEDMMHKSIPLSEPIVTPFDVGPDLQI
ncbi:MAG TPA: 1-acyl-sn-glycerol-3-phosphate acyltransferase [Leptospiraceae bacterium]|nr:1-acyl-sn-glycerol-3-phosphate acyltransferase [Leptospiraceae bacterium]HNI96707.1 1-acyl-sn-glycerol-3-phosphate acyltransferase [Leptospiraceae bacterium]HNM02740.1 1-acyl-sn-glycerol-3-phosphate acyltransferase [Leptospiraceae bacterium]HNN06572.1 1-acyl-sn-glycerol-3-phosphate acyltransferase [Leptospiraceae bacterium]